MCEAPQSEVLLAWYDKHARDLPWRIGPAARKAGAKPDPYRVWLSEIMLQQTTVAAVRAYFLNFTKIWPRVEDLANAKDDRVMAEWAGLGYYARARNLLKCARVVANEYDGSFPDQYDALIKLPGIGPYTAAAIAAIAFDRAETVVDGNVERVMSRIFAVTEPLPKSKPALTKLAGDLTPSTRPGDYAQAVMDLGATICTPRAPACGICPWMENCAARKSGLQADLPAKLPKTKKPTRYGVIYIAQREDGAWLLERRPEKGLLGGMLGWPGSEWGDQPVEAPPIDADWRPCPGEVRHTFTHFHLRLRVMVAKVGADRKPKQGQYFDPTAFDQNDLPTVMRKAFSLAVALLVEN